MRRTKTRAGAGASGGRTSLGAEGRRLSLTRLTQAHQALTFTPMVLAELQRIEVQMGGRQEIVGLLALAPLTRDLRYLLGLLGDPDNTGVSLGELCARGHILPGQLLEQLQRAAMQRGQVLAAQRIGTGIAAVAEDVMRRAAPYEEACHACGGIGTVTPEPTAQVPNPSPGPCDTCRGTGRLRYLPDLERQKLAIDMAHLLPKGGGINIAQINAPSGPAGGGAAADLVESLQQATDKILYGSGGADDEGDPVDGELLDSDAAAPATPADGER